MLTTGIALLPALYEQQEEEEDDGGEEEEEEDDDALDELDDEELRKVIAMATQQPLQQDDDDDDDDVNDENKTIITENTNCLSLCSAAGGGNAANSASNARHDLSLPENDPILQNNKSSIINSSSSEPTPTTTLSQLTTSESTAASPQAPISQPEETSLPKSPSTVVLTTNMALDSFRRSVCIDSDANIDLDAILNDLESLTQMLKSELRPVPAGDASSQAPPLPQKPTEASPAPCCQLPRSGSGDSGSCCPTHATFLPAFNGVELRRKPTSTGAGVSPTKGVVVEVGHHPHHHHQQQLQINPQQHTSWNSSDFTDHSSLNQQHHHQQSPPSIQGATGSNRASIGDSDSAFSESGSTPTGSASAGGAGGSSGSVANSLSNHQQFNVNSSPTSQISALTNGDDDAASRMAKEEKIRIALEKIREAQIRKLCIRIFGPDETTSKTLFIDETTTVRQVIHLLAAKNHVEPNVNWAVVEYYPDLYVHRVIEDHESLVGNMLLWKPDSPNSVRFEMRQDKYDLFARPELYLTGGEDDGSNRLHNPAFDHARRLQLVQECFSDISVRLPHLELSLHLKHPSKKSWRKMTFFMRGSGLYYTTKSKGKASAKDLVCLAQFEHVNLYVCSPDYQKKFKAPTPYGFVLKHPQLQKRCKYVHYLCADTEQELARWCMCIRLAKYGKQLAENYATLSQDIAVWPSERGLSAAGLLQKVTGLTPPVVTPLRHSFTPSMGSGTTLTDDRSTPSSVIMSTSAAARLAASAEQLVIIGPQQSELLQQYQQHRQYQYHQQQQQQQQQQHQIIAVSNNDYEPVGNIHDHSPRPHDERPMSPPTGPTSKPPNGTNTSNKKKHIRFSDDPESLLSDPKQDQGGVYDNATEAGNIWRQHHGCEGNNAGQMAFPPPPPPLSCHEYDVIAERPLPTPTMQQQQQVSVMSTTTLSAHRIQFSSLPQHQFAGNNNNGPNRALSPRRMPSPQPEQQQQQYDADGCPVSPQQQQQPKQPAVVLHSESMQYGIIVKPPVPNKPRYPGQAGPLSPRNDGVGADAKPQPPPRTSTMSSGIQKNSLSTSSAGNLLINNLRQGPATSSLSQMRPLVDITGELDKLLSARAARLERLWNQEDDTPDAALNGAAYPPPASLLMASQELTSEETGTIKKRPPPPPRRNDCQTSPFHHQY